MTDNLPMNPSEWEEEAAREARDAVAREAVRPPYLGTRGGVLTFKHNPIVGNMFSAVILDAIHENVYFDGPFDADAPRSPACFALSADGKNMAPHPDADQPQAETCAKCPWNQFGTAEKGKGKACKQTRRLILIPEQSCTDEESITNADTAMLKIPVTSVKDFGEYVAKLAGNYRIPTTYVSTVIAPVPDPKCQFKITFKVSDRLSLELWPALKAKKQAVQNMLWHSYDPPLKAPDEPVNENAGKRF